MRYNTSLLKVCGRLIILKDRYKIMSCLEYLRQKDISNKRIGYLNLGWVNPSYITDITYQRSLKKKKNECAFIHYNENNNNKKKYFKHTACELFHRQVLMHLFI